MSQYLRPDSDEGGLALLAVGGATLDACINETSPDDDTSYAQGSSNSNWNHDFGLSDGTDPNLSTGHILRFRFRQTLASSPGEKIELIILQGSTQIATTGLQEGDVGYQTFTYTLTGTEADSITDYTDLHFRFQNVTNPSGHRFRITWAEFEIPDAPVAKSGSETGTGTESASVAATASGAETGSGTDTGQDSAAVSGSETGAGVESGSLAAAASGAEAGTDAEDAALAAAASGAETGSGTDTSSGIAFTVTETGAGTEAATLAAAGSGSESGSGADSGSASNGPSGGDSGSGSDNGTPSANIGGSDSGSGADLTPGGGTGGPSAEISVSEVGGLAVAESAMVGSTGTGGTRTIHVTGHGSFALDPIIQPFTEDFATGSHCAHTKVDVVRDINTGLNIPWAPRVKLEWYGVYDSCWCEAFLPEPPRIEYRGNPCDGTREWRYVISWGLRIFRPPAAPQEITASETSLWASVYSICDVFPFDEPRVFDIYNVFLLNAIGAFDLTDDADLTLRQQITPVPGRGDWYETKGDQHSTVTASCDFTFVVTQQRVFLAPAPGGSPEPPPSPPPAGQSGGEPPGGGGGGPDLPYPRGECMGSVSILKTISDSLSYDKVGGDQVLGAVQGAFGYRKSVYFQRMGLHIAHTGFISYNDSSLACLGPPWDITDADFEFSGTFDSTAFWAWTGPEADLGASSDGVPIAPEAGAQAMPSWADEFELKVYKFEDGSPEATAYRLEAYGFFLGLSTPGVFNHLGSATSPGHIRYPESDLVHCWDVGAQRKKVNAVGYQLYHLRDWNPLHFPRRQDINPNPGATGELTGSSLFLSVDPDWADTTGRYIASKHPWVPPRTVWLHLQNAFIAGHINYASTHQFHMFDTATNWEIRSTGNWLTPNPGYSDDVSLSLDSGALKAVVGTAKALVDTHGHYAFKPFGYRYMRLRWKANLAGKKIRVGIGDSLFLFGFGYVEWFPRYGWEFTAAADDTYQVDEFDLAIPTYQGQVGLDGSVSWGTFGKLAHPATWLPFGATVWVEYEDAGTFHADYIEGHYDTTGDRIPIRYWTPLDGFGDSIPYPGLEEIFVDRTKPPLGHKMSPNGVLGYFMAAGPWSWDSAFDRWELLLSNTLNDTGIQFTRSVVAAMGYAELGGGDLTESRAGNKFGKTPAPGVDEAIKAQPRVGGPFGFYGMGDVHYGGSYNRVLQFKADWLWDGAQVGNVGNGGSATLELKDNDTEASLDTDTTDDDGYYQLETKYGVIRPYSNPRFDPTGGAGFNFDPNPTGDKQWSGIFPPFTYTTLGKRLNAHWLAATGLTADLDGSGYVLDGPNRFLAVILDRGVIWRDFVAVPEPKSGNPWNLQTGIPPQYYRTDVVSGRVWVYRAVNQLPPFETATQGHPGVPATDGPMDSHPRLAMDLKRKLLLVPFMRTHGGLMDVLETWSDSDGADFGEPYSTFAGAGYPAIAVDRWGGILRVAWQAGRMVVRYQDPGAETPGGAVIAVDQDGNPLELEEDVIGLAALPTPRAEWVMFARCTCDPSGPTVMRTHDDGQSWEVWSSFTIPGGTHPEVRVGRDGTLLFAAVVGSNIKVGRVDPGEVGLPPVLTLVDQTATAIVVADDTFGVCEAEEPAARFVYALHIDTEDATSEHVSPDDGTSAQRIT